MLCIALVLMIHWASNLLSLGLAGLPIEGSKREIKAIEIPEIIKTEPIAATLADSNFDAAFTRPLKASVITAEDTAITFINNSRVSAIAAEGAIVNRKYYQIGEFINANTKLVGVKACTAQFGVSNEQGEKVSVYLKGC